MSTLTRTYATASSSAVPSSGSTHHECDICGVTGLFSPCQAHITRSARRPTGSLMRSEQPTPPPNMEEDLQSMDEDFQYLGQSGNQPSSSASPSFMTPHSQVTPQPRPHQPSRLPLACSTKHPLSRSSSTNIASSK